MPAHKSFNGKNLDKAKQLRKKMTDEERLLWYGYLSDLTPKFYRQRPIGPFIVDFYCPEVKIVVEIDGWQHLRPEDKAYDEKRSKYLYKQGIKTLRFDNSQIKEDASLVRDEIIYEIMKITGEAE